MNSVKSYLIGLKRSIFHRGETFALEGGICFGPGSGDPKGSFYSKPKLAIYWHQPDSVTLTEDHQRPKDLLKSLVMKLGSLRMSA